MKVVDDLLLRHFALLFGGLGKEETIGAMHNVSEIDGRSELTPAIDLCELTLFTDSKSVDVGLQYWRQLLDPEKLLRVLLAHRLM